VDSWGGDLQVNLDSSSELKTQWETNLGISTSVNNVEGQPTAETRHIEGQYMLKIALMAEMDIWTFPDQIFPITNKYSFPLAGRWYKNGGDTCKPSTPEKQYAECGMKPEPGSAAERLQKIYLQGLNAKDIEARHQLFWDAVKIYSDEGPFILGVAGDQPATAIATDRMQNILNMGVTGPWAPDTPGNQVPAQWWIKE